MKKSKKELDLNESVDDIGKWLKYAEEEAIRKEKLEVEEKERKYKEYLNEQICFNCLIDGKSKKMSIKREDLQELIRSSGVLDSIQRSVNHYEMMNTRFM